MKVLVACEYSGVVREEFRKLGHDAWSCDILPTEIEGKHIQGDVLNILNDGWDLMIAHPPCTYLSISGNRWFKPEYKELFPTRFEDREKAIEFFMQLANAPIPKICIENPVGIMSTIWRKSDQIIQPYQFGHPEQKKTCLWLKGLPLLTPTNEVEQAKYQLIKSGKRIPEWYSNAPKKERGKIRSKTFKGIAQAMAEQWTKGDE